MSKKGKGAAVTPSVPEGEESPLVNLPRGMKEDEWLDIIDNDAGCEVADDVVGSLVEDILGMVHEQTVSSKAKPYAARRCREYLSTMVEAHFLNRDVGEPSIHEDSLWMMDEEPVRSAQDSWARGSVPVVLRRKSTHFVNDDLSSFQSVFARQGIDEGGEEPITVLTATQPMPEDARLASAASAIADAPLDGKDVVRRYNAVKDIGYAKACIGELKSLHKPPALVQMVTEAVCVLHGMHPRVAREWKNQVKMLRDNGLLFEMMSSDPTQIPTTIDTIRSRFISNPDFTPAVLNNVSLSAAAMCEWVHLHEQYARLSQSMSPEDFAALKQSIEAEAKAARELRHAESVQSLKHAESVQNLKLTQARNFDVDKVTSMMEKAFQAVSELGTGHLRELRRFSTPPKEVAEVLEAVMILKGGTPNWLSAKKALGIAFMSELLEFDTDMVSEQTLSLLAGYDWVVAPSFKPDIIYATLCPPAGAICMWVRAIYVYCRALTSGNPKIMILREAVKSKTKERVLRQTEASLTTSGTTSRLVFMNGGKELVGVDITRAGKSARRMVPDIDVSSQVRPKLKQTMRLKTTIRPTPPKQPNTKRTLRTRPRPVSEVAS